MASAACGSGPSSTWCGSSRSAATCSSRSARRWWPSTGSTTRTTCSSSTPPTCVSHCRGRTLDLRARAAGNRREYERELGRRAVPRILTSEGETVYGPAAPAEPPAGTLRGTGVSPGVHEGVVRVLDSPVGADLEPGEVLVAATTDPGWTPLFLLAGALVMEVGGVVSHGAVVAREYGIPAVAAVPDATRRLRTGQRVRVDGGTGVVRVLDEELGAPSTADR